jgi:hypothetical protein
MSLKCDYVSAQADTFTGGMKISPKETTFWLSTASYDTPTPVEVSKTTSP